MVAKTYEVGSYIICAKCKGRMFYKDDNYGQYLECLNCSHTVDIKVNSSYVSVSRSIESGSSFYLSRIKPLIYGNSITKSDVIGV
jgi:DNA-directed RNA polymerase subunit RPC12/RpoP